MPFRPGVRWHVYYRKIAQDVMHSETELAAEQREKAIKDTAAKEAAKKEKEREDGKKPKDKEDDGDKVAVTATAMTSEEDKDKEDK